MASKIRILLNIQQFQIRTDIPHKSPTNKGKNQNLLDLIDNRIKGDPVLWTHENVNAFIESKEKFNAKVRYLPPSRTPLWSMLLKLFFTLKKYFPIHFKSQ